jgi:TonB family protein
MDSPGKELQPLAVRDSRSPEFPDGVRPGLDSVFRAALGPELRPEAGAAHRPAKLLGEFDMWRDVFVAQGMPWGRFLQSALLHAAAVYVICTTSLSLMQEQKILAPPAFDRSSLVTYTPEEYLPPLDTGQSEAPKPEVEKAQQGDPVSASPVSASPVYARQPILSVPPEADNHSQTIVVPPDLKLDHDVPLPNMVATGAVAPAIPLDATRAGLNRLDAPAPEPQVVAPTPDVALASNRGVQTGMKSDVIAPPPEVTRSDAARSTKGLVGPLNIGPSDVVAPTPQLALAEQHSLAARGGGRATGGGIQPVAPAPSVAAGSRSGGRLIALGIHPVTPNGPVPVPAGNRRGEFAANTKGKPGASGTPDLSGAGASTKSGAFSVRNSSLPAGLHVGAGNSGDATEMAGLSSTGATGGARSNPRAASPVADDHITELDRKVFGGKRVYGRTLNMPNLNSSTGSWVIKFAELDGGRNDGELLEPVAMEKSDPGYPLELIRANVHGMVTLYAVIHADGKVGDIRVLNSPDERLDSYAAKALAGWKFAPAEKAGKPVALEAVVMIPFKVRRNF